MLPNSHDDMPNNNIHIIRCTQRGSLHITSLPRFAGHKKSIIEINVKLTIAQPEHQLQTGPTLIYRS